MSLLESVMTTIILNLTLTPFNSTGGVSHTKKTYFGSIITCLQVPHLQPQYVDFGSDVNARGMMVDLVLTLL